MNDEEQLEQELKQFAPTGPTQRLEQALAERLDDAGQPQAAPSGRRRKAVLGCLVGGLAAVAAVALAICLAPPPGATVPAGVPPESARLTVEQIKALPPTEWGYCQAARSSPQDLAIYIEHQANTLLPRFPESGP